MSDRDISTEEQKEHYEHFIDEYMSHDTETHMVAVFNLIEGYRKLEELE